MKKKNSNYERVKPQTRVTKAFRIVGSFGAVNKNKTFIGKVLQIISRFTWELPQQIIALLAALLTNIFGGIKSVRFQNGALVVENKWMGANIGFTLGNILTVGVGSGIDTISHEYGHYIQSRRFGIGYLFGFALPSVARAALWSKGYIKGAYDNFYTERSASKLGKKYWR